jgi:hypothetical protein
MDRITDPEQCSQRHLLSGFAGTVKHTLPPKGKSRGANGS